MTNSSHSMVCDALRSIPNIATEFGGCIYHGIKRLWNAEIDQWHQGLSIATYSLYKIPNNNYNIIETWVIESPNDMITLKTYLKEVNRPQDFDKMEKIT